MKRTPKALVALSGGLDSSYTAYLLKQQGYDVDGIHFSNGLVTDETITLIHHIGDFLGITVQFVDVKQQFEQLLDKIDIEICHQYTPNICVLCARDIKFGYVMNYALDHGYDYLATGHYVKITQAMSDVVIEQAIDQSRDQSYGFGVIPKTQLMHALTPLGSLLKTEIRQNAMAIGLPFIHKESHGLCFTKIPFNQFYIQRTRYPLIHGRFIGGNHSSVHQGQQLYTKGQKICLRGQPTFIKDKLPNGDIIVTPKKDLYESKITINQLNFMVDPQEINPVKTYQIMIRYNADLVSCHLTHFTDNQLTVVTDTEVYAPTIGQIGTIYDGTHILVGGFIC
jgi:tRNA-specific 2-thiouridylase